MLSEPSLLVVDDEESICQGCRRIFSNQGYRVDVSSRAPEGLSLAEEGNYSAILLDINMPNLDGINFLKQLRRSHPDVPVIFITGYPSLPYATSAVRLGASDFITKPFTPQDITNAVERSISKHENRALAADKSEDATTATNLEPWSPASDDILFLDESWFQAGSDGTYHVGATLPRHDSKAKAEMQLPKIGERVYQGIPWAEVDLGKNGKRILRSPVTGTIVETTKNLGRDSAVLEEPCAEGWIIRVEPAQKQNDPQVCLPRRIVVINNDSQSVQRQTALLTSVGCRVSVVSDIDKIAETIAADHPAVVLLNTATLGDKGPELAGWLAQNSPQTRIVVVAAADAKDEAEYRRHKVFYYAVEPLDESELVDVLDGAFRRVEKPIPDVVPNRTGQESLAGLWIRNRHGKEVKLLAPGGLLKLSQGLGKRLRTRLLEGLFPVETTLGNSDVAQITILDAARKYDHVMILLTRDIGRPVGSLVCESKDEMIELAAGAKTGKVTTMVVQPDDTDGGLDNIDSQIIDAMCDHIVQMMVDSE